MDIEIPYIQPCHECQPGMPALHAMPAGVSCFYFTCQDCGAQGLIRAWGMATRADIGKVEVDTGMGDGDDEVGSDMSTDTGTDCQK